MNLFAPIRRHRRRCVARVLSILAVAWLGAVAQPCLAAAEADDHCPHCPTAMLEVGVPEGCTFIDSDDYDTRALDRFAHDAPGEHSMLVAPSAGELRIPRSAYPTGPPARDRRRAPTPRLNVLFCTYLN